MTETLQGAAPAASLEDQTLLVFARLMEGGQEDETTCRELDQLTKLLNDDAEAQQKDKNYKTVCSVIDGDCVDTVLCYLDMRQPDIVRGHATLTTSAYLKAAGDEGSKNLSAFFFERVQRGTYDDYIVAFCVASATFPIVPDLTVQLFLGEGFLSTLGPLMRREWKSRKVETACLEMLNAACMNPVCREAVQKYCVEWLEEVVDQDPTGVTAGPNQEPLVQGEGGSISMRRHSEQVQHLAAVILAKLKAVPSNDPNKSRVEPVSASIEDLSGLFTKMILRDEEDYDKQHSIEGLAYASIQPKIKESTAKNDDLLKKLVKALSDAPPRSPITYGALSIFVNLTRYMPALTEEQKKMSQLKAYANASGKLPGPDPLDDDEHVAKRCQAVFGAGIIPVLVTHSKNGSVPSLGLIISIIHSIAVTTSLRGPLAQQGAVKLLLVGWAAIPETDESPRRAAAQALARILISTNPALVFGGNRSNPINAAIRPLIYILPPDPAAETRDLLPTFEALMALTNLASLEDEDTRSNIIRLAWPHVEEQLLSSNKLVSKAAAELVCNLMQTPEGIALYADGSAKAGTRLHILLALADAEEEGARSAAGGALASLTGFESVVRYVVQRDRAVKVILGMCNDSNPGLRHRGVVTIYNLVMAEGDAGQLARDKVKEENGVEILKECLRQSRQPEVLQITVEALKVLLDQKQELIAG
ncbi:SWI5-dependent HO expression protein 4 [Conoideocrella luteorostrata]|uniref:SWI5-dependent HO expression protein 4 n=1 Tax=Conoideocrella luteorostrata TaxID=1105319 RepID=A0AAJ0FXV7_9HYPO|nr:SWI5-dependent HO expression protein 4 [Conoideocrella luteorostrata]